MDKTVVYEWRRLAEVNRRLALLGRAHGIEEWHALINERFTNYQPPRVVKANIPAMTDRQVVAFVRRHGRDNPHVMLDLWMMIDRRDHPETAPFFVDTSGYEPWRRAAMEIAGWKNEAIELKLAPPR